MFTFTIFRSSRLRLTAAFFSALFLLTMGSANAEGTATAEAWGPITVVGRTVEPGTSSRFSFAEKPSFRGWYLNSPVFVARGSTAGPTLCLTAGIHGDELNGVEVARRAFSLTDATQLKGTLIAVPAINAEGVRTGSRYLSDRRDLNRAFPGKEGGSIASLIAWAVTSYVLPHCDFVIDLHTGSDSRANVPQIRADLDNDAVRGLAMHFGHGIVVGGAGPDGSWRREAVKAGVPAIIYEAGEPLRFEPDEIAHGVEGVRSVMAYLEMIDAPVHAVAEDQVYTRSTWLRAGLDQSGFFFPLVALGDQVEKGDLLGRIVDPITDFEHEIRAPMGGKLIGMAVSRPVLSGYGLFHLAWVK
jgi:predicted deacylase